MLGQQPTAFTMLQASSLGHEVECWKVALIVVIPIAHLSCVLFGGCLNCNIKGSSLVPHQLEIWLKEFINPRAAVIAAGRCHTNSICDFQYASGFFWCCSSKAQAKSTAPTLSSHPHATTDLQLFHLHFAIGTFYFHKGDVG